MKTTSIAAIIRRLPPLSLVALSIVMILAALSAAPAFAGSQQHNGKHHHPSLDCSEAKLPPTTRLDFKCIDEGFRVFTEETFEGNGRACATCHIPEENYNIFPSTIKKLNVKEKRLVFAPHVPGLENRRLIRKFALFNIAGNAHSNARKIRDFNSEFCEEHPHDCAIFRSTMTVQALDSTSFVSSGAFGRTPLLDAECSEGDMLDANGNPILVVDADGVPIDPPGGATQRVIDVKSQLPQLGWAGDGSPGTPKGNADAVDLTWNDGQNRPGAAQGRADGGGLLKCRSHHGNEDPNADGSIRAFSNGAIAQHNPKTLKRIAKTTACPNLSVDDPDAHCDAPYDFRFATNLELDVMALFQRWLGRRPLNADEQARMIAPDPATDNPSRQNTEFDTTLLQYTDRRIRLGEIQYNAGFQFGGSVDDTPAETFGAGCNVCHVNGGAIGNFAGGGNQATPTSVELSSSQRRRDHDGLLVDLLGGEIGDIYFVGAGGTMWPLTSDYGMEIFGDRKMHDPNALVMGDIAFPGKGVDLPFDEGTFFVAPNADNPLPENSFNIQSIIESPQKKAHFHNHMVEGDVEDTIRKLYGTRDFAMRDNSVGHTTLLGQEYGDPTPTEGSSVYFPNGDGIEHVGAFVRALSAYYKLRDCERLIDEAINRVYAGVSPKLATQHCGFNLKDVRTALRGSHLRPRPHRDVMSKTNWLGRALNQASYSRNVHKLRYLKGRITAMKESIATLPEPVTDAI